MLIVFSTFVHIVLHFDNFLLRLLMLYVTDACRSAGGEGFINMRLKSRHGQTGRNSDFRGCGKERNSETLLKAAAKSRQGSQASLWSFGLLVDSKTWQHLSTFVNTRLPNVPKIAACARGALRSCRGRRGATFSKKERFSQCLVAYCLTIL